MSDVFDNIEKVKQQLQELANEAAIKAAEEILGAAIEYVPVQTGELRDSGHVTEDGKVVFDADHALLVHETHDHGFKFLVRATEDVDVQAILESYLSKVGS